MAGLTLMMAAAPADAAAADSVGRSEIPSARRLVSGGGYCDFKPGDMGPNLFCDHGRVIVSSSGPSSRSLRGSNNNLSNKYRRRLVPDFTPVDEGLSHMEYFEGLNVGSAAFIPIMPGPFDLCTSIIEDWLPDNEYIYACTDIRMAASDWSDGLPYASWIPSAFSFEDRGVGFQQVITPELGVRGRYSGMRVANLYRCPGNKFTSLSSCSNPLGQIVRFPFEIEVVNRSPAADPEFLLPGYNETLGNSTIIPRYKTIETGLGGSYSVTYRFIEKDRDAVQATMQLVRSTSTNGVVTSMNVGFVANQETDVAGNMVISGMPPLRSQGTYTFRVTVEDKRNAFELYGGKLIIDFDVVVKDRPIEPGVSPLPAADILVAEEMNYFLSGKAFIDKDDDTILIEVDGSLPDFLEFNQDSLRVYGSAKPEDRGHVKFRFKATTEFQIDDPVYSEYVEFDVLNSPPFNENKLLPGVEGTIGSQLNVGLPSDSVTELRDHDSIHFGYSISGADWPDSSLLFGTVRTVLAVTCSPYVLSTQVYSTA
jgi:hypothetical protein